MKLTIRFKGGAGSGHFGHKGRPGEQGGSLPKGNSASDVSEDSGKMDAAFKRSEYRLTKFVDKNKWDKSVNKYTKYIQYTKLSTDGSTKVYMSYSPTYKRLEVGFVHGGSRWNKKSYSMTSDSGLSVALEYATQLATAKSPED